VSLLERTVEKVYPQNSEMRDAARNRLDNLALPHWALGDLMDLAIDLAGITGSMTPEVKRKAIVTMAGDHGVVAENVSKYPSEVTSQMVYNFVNGGAGINALAGQAGAEVHIVDMGVAVDLGELVSAGKIINKKVGRPKRNIKQYKEIIRKKRLTDNEKIKLLGISRRTYYYYKNELKK